MIKFFRHIRKSLLTENKFSKYMLYAIGEIVLVVIGILIALQINTWNQNRLEVSEEKVILNNIHAEFLQNKETLKKTVLEINLSFNSGKKLFNLIGKERSEIEKHNLDSLIFSALEYASFRPTENTISDLLQSGRLQLLKNTNLKDLLYLWSRNIMGYENARNRVEIKVDEELVPYLSKHYSMKDIDMHGRLAWKTKSNLNIDKLHIFEDIEFENILDDYLYRISTGKINLKELERVIDEIIKETASHND